MINIIKYITTGQSSRCKVFPKSKIVKSSDQCSLDFFFSISYLIKRCNPFIIHCHVITVSFKKYILLIVNICHLPSTFIFQSECYRCRQVSVCHLACSLKIFAAFTLTAAETDLLPAHAHIAFCQTSSVVKS